MALHPLPVQLNQLGSNTVGTAAIESVSYRTEGLLHLADWGFLLEWTTTQTTQRVSMVGEVGTDVKQLPKESVEVPFEDVASIRLVGWWHPRLEIRAKGLDVFAGVPGAQGVNVWLRVERRDRSLARAHAIEIGERAAAADGELLE
ncbi:MAG: hypothetical protein IT352_12350 [Gemmatimonadales bacterium]|nr:hypothetical protein [Gemmatimonadales bacterium]